MAKLPTPEQLGEMLKEGKITEGEAVEIMAERARAEALSGLFGGGTARGEGEEAHAGRRGAWSLPLRIAAVVLIVAAGVILGLLLLLAHLLG